MTSSARSSSEGGTVIPSALGVFRVILRNFVVASTDDGWQVAPCLASGGLGLRGAVASRREPLRHGAKIGMELL